MRIDVVIASRNGGDKLRANLWTFPMRSIAAHGVGLILVDNASSDDTAAVMRAFAEQHPLVRTLHFPVPGQSLAQNAALRLSHADLIVFIDDDCVPGDDYFDVLRSKLDLRHMQYGSGEILVPDPRYDMRVANTHWWTHAGDLAIPPRSLMMPGLVQGANMFFSRALLETIGGLQPLGRKCASDTLTAYEASSAGFTGVVMRGPKVYHHHGRLAGSAEADETASRYDDHRGAFYAAVLARGDARAFDLWKSQFRSDDVERSLRTLKREFAAAAAALKGD